jgi:hypothetical protein
MGMKYVRHTFSLLVVAASVLLLAACGQKSSCNGITFGASGGSGSGTGSGVNSGGSSCGVGSNNGGGGGSASDFVFYRGSSGANNAIDTAELTATTFQVVPGVAALTGNSTTGTMVVVKKQFLYLPDQNGSGGVMGFSINHTDGGLTPIPGSPFAAPSAVTTIVADPDANGARFLFTVDFTSGDFNAFTINASTGALTLVPTSPLSFPGYQATDLKIDGTGNYLYAIAAGTRQGTLGFLVDQNSGGLTPVSGSPFQYYATGIQINPAGTYMLAVTGANQIDVIPIEQGTGNLLLSSLASFPTVNLVNSLVIHPSGNFVYTFGTRISMEGFQFTGGALTELTGSPYTSLSDLGACQFDQSGTALFGILTPSNQVGVRIINPTTGAVTAGPPDLSVQTGPYFAVTN